MFKIDDAPGLAWKNRHANGYEARWQARTDIIRRGYEVKSVKLWGPSTAAPTAKEAQWVADQCQRLQAEMAAWAAGGTPQAPGNNFDGTLANLTKLFQDDPDSRFQGLRYKTRQRDATTLRRMSVTHGTTMIADIDARMLLGWHRTLCSERGVASAHQFMTKLRALASFGKTLLKDAACITLSDVLSELEFKLGEARTAALTAQQATDVREQAHADGLHSIALAQAFQFDCTFRQKDVIGEYVPMREPVPSDVLWPEYGIKWLRGIRWSEIDSNLILRHKTSKRDKWVEIDLKLAPMVMEEFKLMGMELPASGPVIISENTGMPWGDGRFRQHWRRIANKVGVPANVRNMDTRAGAMTEADDAGAVTEDISKTAAHASTQTTARYVRNNTRKIAKVMTLRKAHREQIVEKNESGRDD